METHSHKNDKKHLITVQIDQSKYRKAKQILVGEGTSMSKYIRSLLEDLIDRHTK